MLDAGAYSSPSSNGIHVGPFDIRIYGLCYVLAVLAAVAITTRRWEAQGGSRELVQDVALWGFPAGIIGGRLYFLATSWNEVPDHWWGPFAVWKGGLGIWGGIALGTAAGIWRLRRAGADVPRFLDAAAPALLVAQAIGRIGNYFNQELYGRPTSLPWGLEIDRDHRPARYLDSATFHPTFLYEIIWNLALAAFLVWLGRRRAIRAPGLFALYVAGYSAFRIFEELLRVDPAKHVLGLRLNFFIAAVLTVVGLTWFVRTQRRVRENGRHEEEPMKIVVFGAGGRVGTRTVAEALARGHEVTAGVRDPSAPPPPGRPPPCRATACPSCPATPPIPPAWPRSPPATTSPSAPSGPASARRPRRCPPRRAPCSRVSRARAARGSSCSAAPAASRSRPACASSTPRASARSGSPTLWPRPSRWTSTARPRPTSTGPMSARRRCSSPASARASTAPATTGCWSTTRATARSRWRTSPSPCSTRPRAPTTCAGASPSPPSPGGGRRRSARPSRRRRSGAS